MLESMFVKEGFQIGLISPKAFPLGSNSPGTVRSGPGEATINHRCPSAHTGADEGRPCTQPFLVESLSGSRQSPQRNFSPAPLGKSIAPHPSPSVTASPREASGLCSPTRKKRPKSGHADGRRNSPTTGTMRHNRQNERASSERAITQGGGGYPRDSLRPGFL